MVIWFFGVGLSAQRQRYQQLTRAFLSDRCSGGSVVEGLPATRLQFHTSDQRSYCHRWTSSFRILTETDFHHQELDYLGLTDRRKMAWLWNTTIQQLHLLLNSLTCNHASSTHSLRRRLLANSNVIFSRQSMHHMKVNKAPRTLKFSRKNNCIMSWLPSYREWIWCGRWTGAKNTLEIDEITCDESLTNQWITNSLWKQGCEKLPESKLLLLSPYFSELLSYFPFIPSHASQIVSWPYRSCKCTFI